MMSQNEQGFTLIESLCAVVITSLTVLLAATLWQTSLASERQSALQTELTRQATAKLERLRAETHVVPRDDTFHLESQGSQITEQITILPEGGLYRVTLTYTWQERGRTREQTWATYHP
ncbi:prepilin-type N-terminal cleavage/methylation domain-containing protein [Tumebacillus sp. BK434]|uniref:type IV pilus modification PilV family protein n=1 Tax=Tumebacillus sp. BK434 TaxID=2512169 RepID=UPI001044C821|nr:type II secretion system protein [Tumebacillus sp. BK434]TCP59647.1 prepilin-type N-terminal cleavage/methylation domain-containing protein [Tumebacillus sp. BK434]